VIGLGGEVATTALAGIAMRKGGSNTLAGLPLTVCDVPRMAACRDMVFGGWDLAETDLGAWALRNGVIGEKELTNGASSLTRMRAGPAVGSIDFYAGMDGGNKIAASGHRETVKPIQADPRSFRDEQNADRVALVNLAPNEPEHDFFLQQGMLDTWLAKS
jgi:myo-inositol-1-phosphate synthase